MEAIRRADLVEAAISVIGEAGSLDVTVGQIARRAGVSPALAHHYFGQKDRLFLAAMRHILTQYGVQVRGALAAARGPRERVEAILRASFGEEQFRPEVISAWLNFYVLSQTLPEARRLLAIYQARLQSNLVHSLRPIVGLRAEEVARALGAMIDGVYIREALKGTAPDGVSAAAMVMDCLERELRA